MFACVVVLSFVLELWLIVVELTLMLIRISSFKRLRVVLLIELVRVHRRWPSRKTLCPTGKVDQRGQEQGKEEGRISLSILVPEEEEREESPILRSLVLLPRPVCHAFGKRRTGVCHTNQQDGAPGHVGSQQMRGALCY